jgi:hypothetical protein
MNTTASNIDSTSFGNDGTANGNPALFSGGRIGNAIDFDGNDFFNHGDDDDFEPGDDFTFAFWVKDNETIGQEGITSKWNNAPVTGFYAYSEVSGTDNMTLEMADNGARATIKFGRSDITAWNHVVGTYDGTTFTAYLNGASVGTDLTVSGSVLANNNPFLIGCWFTAGYNDIIGQIDEVRISNISRSSDWVNASYLSQTNQVNIIGAEETEPVTPNVTALTVTSYCFTEDVLYKVVDAYNDSGQIVYNERYETCQYGCQNETIWALGAPGCAESPWVQWLIIIIMLVIFSAYVRWVQT